MSAISELWIDVMRMGFYDDEEWHPADELDDADFWIENEEHIAFTFRVLFGLDLLNTMEVSILTHPLLNG